MKKVDRISKFRFLDIVHRDLKLENILLKNNPTSKTDEFDIRVKWRETIEYFIGKQISFQVTDFGLSSKQSIINTDSLFNEYCGTPL